MSLRAKTCAAHFPYNNNAAFPASSSYVTKMLLNLDSAEVVKFVTQTGKGTEPL